MPKRWTPSWWRCVTAKHWRSRPSTRPDASRIEPPSAPTPSIGGARPARTDILGRPLQDSDQQRADAEAARHIVEVCDDLRRIAKGPRLKTVSYLLGLVRLEAEKLLDESRE